MPMLLNKKISGFKIIDPKIILDAFIKKSLNKIGNKQFTIYQFYNKKLGDTEWQKLLQDIDNALQQANIKPANPPLVDNKIQGSDYFSYRNDTHPNNPSNRIDPDAAYDFAKKDKTLKSYNLINATDPFENITLGDQPTFTKG